jgi:hypothetical protein
MFITPTFYMRTETDPVSEALSSFRIWDDERSSKTHQTRVLYVIIRTLKIDRGINKLINSYKINLKLLFIFASYKIFMEEIILPRTQKSLLLRMPSFSTVITNALESLANSTSFLEWGYVHSEQDTYTYPTVPGSAHVLIKALSCVPTKCLVQKYVRIKSSENN